MIVHVLDGTYELFRHFYGLRRFNKGKDKPLGAVAGVLHSVLEMIEKGAHPHRRRHRPRDRVVPQRPLAGLQDRRGHRPALWAQFHPLEEALVAMGVVVWPMVELEADDALASAARLAAEHERVEQVCIWANDKDLAQCVRDDRVVQVDRRNKEIRNADGGAREVRGRAGADPRPAGTGRRCAGRLSGHRGHRQTTASRLLNRYGPIESFPSNVLGDKREQALLFKDLATLRTDAPLFRDVDELAWRGPGAEFPAWADRIGDKRLLERCRKAAQALP